MPRHPGPAAQTAAMPGAIYSALADKIAQIDGPIFPLHVGDTFMEPVEGSRMENLCVADHPGMHRYTRPQGHADLVDALLEKCRSHNGLPVERAGITVTAGATAGLAAAMGAICDPGDEVLILAPFWPLIRGHVQCFRAKPVEVPFYDRVHSLEAAVEAVRERITPRSVALYVSTPSNPTGVVLPEDWLRALAELAREHDLWLLSDETYEDYAYRGKHVSIGAFAPERSITAFSFSKAYGMAGNRVGYLAAPSDISAQIRKVSSHTYFSAPTGGQLGALHALRNGQAWIDRAHQIYKAAGDDAADVLGVPRPAGSTFLFLNLEQQLDDRGVFGFLEDCLDDGLLLAPGPSFGVDYASWVRVCFTSAPPEAVADAVRRLARRVRPQG
jgi:aspartate/methionine/tyrosine aminotransferase